MHLSQNSFNRPLHFTLVFNKTVQWMVIAVHFLVASILVLTTNSIIITTLLLLLVLGSFLYHYQWQVSQSLAKSIVAIKLSSTGEWCLFNANNTRIKATLQPSSFLSNHLLILNFHSVKVKKYTVLIPKGRLNPHDFRHLKVHLKTKVSAD